MLIYYSTNINLKSTMMSRVSRVCTLIKIVYPSLQPMLTYSGCGIGAAEAESGSPAGSLLSGEGELPEEAGDSPGTSRDTEEEATLSDEFYSHDTDEEDDQSKKRRDRSTSVS